MREGLEYTCGWWCEMASRSDRAVAHIYKSIDRVADTLSNRLRNHARDSGWPEDVASRLSVVSANGMLVAEIAADREREAEDLEYGTPGSDPRPAVWTFFENHRLDAESRHDVERASNELAHHYAQMVLYP